MGLGHRPRDDGGGRHRPRHLVSRHRRRAGSPLGFDLALAPDDLDRLAVPDIRRAVTLDVVAVEVDLDAAPASTSDAYLRLHALSHRLVRPNEVNLDGIFGYLPERRVDDRGPDASRRREPPAAVPRP